MTLAFAYFAGIAMIVGWSLPRGAAGGEPVRLAARPPESGFADAIGASANPVPATGKARSKVNCAECAVVLSVQRIDTQLPQAGTCAAFSRTRTHDVGNAFADHGRVESLADTVASLIAEPPVVRKVEVTTRHRIVVRFRDGTQQIFDEATPRTFQVGDRIMVIAGAARSVADRFPRDGDRADAPRSKPPNVRSRTDETHAAGETAFNTFRRRS